MDDLHSSPATWQSQFGKKLEINYSSTFTRHSSKFQIAELSVYLHLPSTIHHLPFTIVNYRQPSSTIINYRPHPLSTTHHPPSIVHYHPPSSTHPKLSTTHSAI
ncbi:unnamed protein product [Rhizophagus irregularis]|nr:unnamed protein product [Rhizophagus irregularis]